VLGSSEIKGKRKAEIRSAPPDCFAEGNDLEGLGVEDVVSDRHVVVKANGFIKHGAYILRPMAAALNFNQCCLQIPIMHSRYQSDVQSRDHK
jgi:hypothetical protein